MSVPYVATLTVDSAHQSDIYAVCTTPRYTVTAGGDGKILLWSNQSPNHEPVSLTTELRSGVHHIASDPDGEMLIAVAFDATVAAFDLNNLEQLQIPNITKKLANAGSWACALAANGFAAVSTLRGSIFLLDLRNDVVTGELVDPGAANSGRSAVPTEEGANGETTTGSETTTDADIGSLTSGLPCLAIDISPDRQFVVGTYESGRCRVFRVETRRVAYSLPSHITRPRSVKFNPSGSLIAVTGDESIALFTLNGGSYLGSLLGNDSYVYSIDFDEEGERLLSVAGNGKAKVWSLATREALFTLSENNLPLFTCAWVPTRANTIAGAPIGFVTAGVDRGLRFYREASGSGNELGI